MSERASAMMSASEADASAGQASDRDGLAAWVAPFRQAQTLLGQVTDAARSLADDTLFEDVFTSLSSLPSAANFNPLQAAQSLPVDIAPVQAAVEQAAHIPRQFIEALQQTARSVASSGDAKATRRSSNVNSGQSVKGASPSSMSFAAITDRLSELQQQANTLLTGSKSVPGPSQVLHDALHVTRGSWAALERIAELVQLLEPDAGPGKKPGLGKSSPMAANPSSATRGRSGENAARAAGTSGRMRGQQGEEAVAGLRMLQGLVDAAWGAVSGAHSDADAPAQASADARNERNAQTASPTRAPSPRGASMLNPQLTSRPGGVATTSVQTPSSGSATNDNASSEPRTQPAAGVINDDELAERLNRALIEQAWRGGVDLT